MPNDMKVSVMEALVEVMKPTAQEKKVTLSAERLEITPEDFQKLNTTIHKLKSY